MPRRTLNLGILAHVDAGKTTLTERLLYAAGVIDEVGSVDDGTTQTDSLALERQRGITIKSAVVSFAIGDVTVNLIDTPGHPDFIAEVERALSVLDGAVLVISAVEGVQPQTRILMRALQRLRVPTLLFVNKIDRRGAGYDRVLGDIVAAADAGDRRRWARRAGSARARPAFTPVRRRTTARLHVTGWPRCSPSTTTPILRRLRRRRAGGAGRWLRAELAAQIGGLLVHPVFFGSAHHRRGRRRADAAASRSCCPRRAGTPAARSPAGSSRSSAARPARRSPTCGCSPAPCGSGTGCGSAAASGERGKVTAISVFADGAAVRRESVSAGQIARLWGLAEIQVGDAIGARAGRQRGGTSSPRRRWRRSSCPATRRDNGALRAALAPARRAGPADQRAAGRHPAGDLRLALRRGAEGGHRGHAGDRLRRRRSASARRRTICVERPVGTGAAVERLHQPPNPFLATVGLRVEPAAPGSGVEFRLEVELGSHADSRSSGPSRTPCGRRCSRASTAGRSPTARSR